MLVSTGSISPSVPPTAWTTSSTTPLTPMATGTASPSTVAWATARMRVGTAWYAALSDVRDVPSLKVRSVTRAATIRTNTIVAPEPSDRRGDDDRDDHA